MREENYYSNKSATGRTYTKGDKLTARAYNLSIGLILLWGFIINAAMCAFTSNFFAGVCETHPILFIIAYFVVAFTGIGICKTQESAGSKFLGYNILVFAVGTLLAVSVPEFSAVSILNACVITVIVAVVMVVVSTIRPEVFLSMGKTLFICLVSAIIIECIMLLFGFFMPTLWDFAIVLVFCGFIGYDWAIAQEKEKNLENAIDSCAGLYLDIINIFVRLLGKGGSSKSSK